MIIDYVLFVLAIILFVVFCAIWSLHFVSLIYGRYKFHKKTKRVIEKDKLPGVSIIKPLMGVDDNLMDNLETFFTMNYPLYELLFCFQDVNDPAINVVKTLIDKYPTVNAKMFMGGKQVGINPKINNMIQGYDAANYELLLISDAGLRMADDTLYDMVSFMTDKVGLVHQMPFTCDRPGFAGTLEKVYFGTCHARMYLFINLIGVNCVTGMSCLMRKNVLDEIGGLKKFGVYIAEDFFIAKAYLDRNWIIQLAHQPAMQNSATYSVPSWQKRMIRWCKLRLKLNVASWLEPMQECLMLGLCTSWTVSVLFGWNSLVFFLIHVLGWFLCDYMLLKICQNGKLPFTKCEYIIAWFYRESVCFYLFLKAASNPTVKWREGKYRLKWGSRAVKIEDNKNSSISPTKATPTDILLSEQEAALVSSSTNIIKKNTTIIMPEKTLTTSIHSSIPTIKTHHKRNSSYSLINKSSTNSYNNTSTQQYSNSDMEQTSHTPFLSYNNSTSNQNVTQNSSINLSYFNTNKIFDQQPPPSQSKTPLNNNIRSHMHHHSISSFMLSTSGNNNNNNNNSNSITTNAAQNGSNSSSELTSSKFN